MPDAADVPADLVTRLEHAAADVIRNQGPSIRRDSGSIRSVTVEINLDRRGQLVDAEVYLGRQVSVNSVLRAQR